MPDLQQLFADLAQTRRQLLDHLEGLTPEQGRFKPTPKDWSIAQGVEHIVVTEHECVSSIWSTADALRRGKHRWSVDPKFQGRAVEEVLAKNWRSEQQPPDEVIPQSTGSLGYWCAALRANQILVEQLSVALDGLDPAEVVVPHPFAGPLDAFQWLAFLRFHLELHHGQIEQVTQAAEFPR